MAHVVDDELRRLGGHEDGEQRADAPQVVVVAVQLDDVADEDADRDGDGSRREPEEDQPPRHDLRAR